MLSELDIGEEVVGHEGPAAELGRSPGRHPRVVDVPALRCHIGPAEQLAGACLLRRGAQLRAQGVEVVRHDVRHVLSVEVPRGVRGDPGVGENSWRDVRDPHVVTHGARDKPAALCNDVGLSFELRRTAMAPSGGVAVVRGHENQPVLIRRVGARGNRGNHLTDLRVCLRECGQVCRGTGPAAVSRTVNLVEVHKHVVGFGLLQLLHDPGGRGRVAGTPLAQINRRTKHCCRDRPPGANRRSGPLGCRRLDARQIIRVLRIVRCGEVVVHNVVLVRPHSRRNRRPPGTRDCRGHRIARQIACRGEPAGLQRLHVRHAGPGHRVKGRAVNADHESFRNGSRRGQRAL